LTITLVTTLLTPHWGSVVPPETRKFVSKWSSAERIVAPKEFKMTEAKKPKSKTEVLNALAESTGLSRKDVANVFAQLSELIGKEIGKKGPGAFSLPGLLKIQVVRKPATKASTRENPFKKGEMMVVKAKPARNVVKIRALKSLKDLA
jgi:nucleoid DNA-binding protein